MALKSCRECGQKVSTEAPTCPHCGAKDPTRTRRSGGGIALILIGFIVVLGVIGANNNSNTDNTASGSATQTSSSPPAPTAPTCSDDWRKCADNADLVNHWSGWVELKVKCKEAANDAAKYGTPEWPWLPFGYFHPGRDYIDTGIATAIENDAKFSNGFGAMEKVKVFCDYDLKGKKVTNVNIAEK
jgi:hypothetical protein